jgi:zinc/manganese transport system substrate-binding protein
MILNRFGVAALVVTCTLAATLAACSEGSPDPATPSADGPTVVATTSIWADITSRVLCGVPVDAVIPAGADPHTFEPSLRDRERLDSAALVVANGAGLEESLSDLLGTIAADGVNVVEMTPHIDVIATDDDLDDDLDDDHADQDDVDDDEHGHGVASDPHVWQDPTRVAGALDVIASAGAAIDLGDCAEEFASELSELDAEIDAMLADIPPDRRVLVTSHDSLAYFADRYDLEVIGTVIPSTNTLAETNAADLGNLADLIEQRGVTAVFTEQMESTADADALADRLGVAVVPLVTDTLTDDPATDSYVEMIRSNATRIAEALSP